MNLSDTSEKVRNFGTALWLNQTSPNPGTVYFWVDKIFPPFVLNYNISVTVLTFVTNSRLQKMLTDDSLSSKIHVLRSFSMKSTLVCLVISCTLLPSRYFYRRLLTYLYLIRFDIWSSLAEFSACTWLWLLSFALFIAHSGFGLSWTQHVDDLWSTLPQQ